jgi:hypothetical protein
MERWGNIADMRKTFIARTASVLIPALLLVLVAPAAPAAETPAAPGGGARQELGNLVLDGVPPHDPAVAAKLDDWLAGRGASFRDFLPDGGVLVSTRFGEVEQLHRIAMPLGAREQLTFYPEPIGTAVAPQAAGAAGFAFLKDRGGDENSQVHWYRFADRSVRMLTDGKSLHGGLAWSRDGQQLAFHGNGRDGVSYDIYVADVGAATPPRFLVAGQNRQLQALDWSPDGRRLLLRHFVSANESYLYLADTASGALTPLPTTQPPGAAARPGNGPGAAAGAGLAFGGGGATVAIGRARFSADGTGVWFVSDVDSEFARLLYLDLASGVSREAFAGTTDWDVEDFDVSADGRWIAWTTNVDGVSRLALYDLGARRQLRPANLPAGEIANLRFDREGRRLGMTIDTAQQPRDAWVLEIERNELVRWTRSELGPVDPARFVPAELVRYPTWDRDGGKPRQVPAFVWKPRTAGPHPVLIDIHGGPEAQARPNFSAFTQFLVNELGYAVITPNVRGSSGYGKTCLKLDNGALREDAVQRHRRAARLGRRAARPRREARGGLRRLVRRLHGRSPRWSTTATGCAAASASSASATSSPSCRTPQPTAATCAAPSTATSATRGCARSCSGSRR